MRNKLRTRAVALFRAVDKAYKCSAYWWAREVSVSVRTVYRWRGNQTAPHDRVARDIIRVCDRIKEGFLPPCRTTIAIKAARSRKGPHSNSPHIGVQWFPLAGLWAIHMKGSKSLYFPSQELAAIAYNQRALEKYGEHCAVLNEVDLTGVPVLTCENCTHESIWVYRVKVAWGKKGSRLFGDWEGHRDLCKPCIWLLYDKGEWGYSREFYGLEPPTQKGQR